MKPVSRPADLCPQCGAAQGGHSPTCPQLSPAADPDALAKKTTFKLSQTGEAPTFQDRATLLTDSQIIELQASENNDLVDTRRQAFDVSSASASGDLLETQRSAAGLKSDLRRYADGRVARADGTIIELASSVEALTLPYASHEVQRRIGPYDILDQLGAGAMGVVYKGYSLKLCRPVAIKVITPGSSASAKAITRFHNEAILAARLKHPNIVPIYDSGTAGDIHYFVMAYIPGQSLGDILEDKPKSLSLDEKVRLIVKAARALDYAHKQGVLHRDIKPDNIMIDAEANLEIADFGLATEKPENPDPDKPGAIMGTPSYMPPEQANGELHKLGPESDVYSLGASFYEILVGRPPFEGGSAMIVLTKVLDQEPLPPRELARAQGWTLPLDLDTIVMKCLEKQAAQRYRSAGELADELEAYLRGEPIAARPIGSAERLQKFVLRNRAALVGLIVLGSVLLTLLAGFAALAVRNIEQSSSALQNLELQAALRQARSIEQAIRVNMLQGRADQARELLRTLSNEEPGAIEVVRLDRSIAYSNQSTREAVERRLEDQKVLSWISNQHPDFEGKVQELKRLGFPTISRSKDTEATRLKVDNKIWQQALDRSEATTFVRPDANGTPELTVLLPIENSPKCLVCHGNDPYPSSEAFAYLGDEVIRQETFARVRAVLVMRRSQKELVETIAANRRSARNTGLATAAAFALLLLFFSRALGLGLKPREFGA